MYNDDEKLIRYAQLQSLGGDPSSVNELMDYCQNLFEVQSLSDGPVFPLPEEGHLTDWRNYVAGQGHDPFGFLQERIPQLCIQVSTGISGSEAYSDVVRKGKAFDPDLFQGKLTLKRPDLFNLFIQEHPAGALPVLMVPDRKDFENVVCALAHRNEPREILPSVNAQMVAGLVNWDRVHRYRASWRCSQPEVPTDKAWALEMRRISLLESWRFMDRIIIVTVHPYSSIPAGELGLTLNEDEWIGMSTILRLEHEFTHYATKRLFGRMSLNLLDEIICDWAGITRALGDFRSKWFLKLLGVEENGDIRQDGRIHTYRQNLGDPAFKLLGRLTVEASTGLESLHQSHYQETERDRFFMALTGMTLELMACQGRDEIFSRKYSEAGKLFQGNDQ